jgi:Ca2+-binding RTX toxin-like protein
MTTIPGSDGVPLTGQQQAIINAFLPDKQDVNVFTFDPNDPPTIPGGEFNYAVFTGNIGGTLASGIGSMAGATFTFGSTLDGATLFQGAGSSAVPQNVTGNDAKNLILANDAENVLKGLGGNDLLFGQGGNDSVIGGDGADTLYGGSDDDLVQGGAHRDELFGNNGADTLIGGAGADSIDGGAGSDLLKGDGGGAAGGNDSITGGGGADTLFGFSGNDRLFGDDGTDLLKGGSGDDVVHGGNGNDTLFGNAGDDQLYGEAGKDELTGGSGSDVFHIFDDTSVDTITDFNPKLDKIDLSDTGATSLADLTVKSTQDGLLITVKGGGKFLLEGDFTPTDVVKKWFIF